MGKLSSFNDLKLPKGLFPALESHFIEMIPVDALGALRNKTLEDINADLEIADGLFDGIKSLFRHQPFLEKIDEFKTYLKNREEQSWDDEMERQQTLKSKNESLLIGIIAKARGADDKSVENALSMFENISDGFNDYQHLYAIMSIRLYQEGINKAIELRDSNAEYQDGYMLLGRVAKYFYAANALHTAKAITSTEINAIKVKDNIEKKQRKEIAKKGGGSSYSATKPVQRRCVEQYIKAKDKNEKLVRISFIRTFIESLSPQERKPFSANIEENLKKVIRDYEKGTISPNIWPGNS